MGSACDRPTFLSGKKLEEKDLSFTYHSVSFLPGQVQTI